jgi:hypothetical protein
MLSDVGIGQPIHATGEALQLALLVQANQHLR